MTTKITRRAAVASLASAPMISTAAIGSATATDPIFAVIEAAKAAEAAFHNAIERAESEAPALRTVLKCEATGVERIATDAEGIDSAVRSILLNIEFEYAAPVDEGLTLDQIDALFAEGREARKAFEAANNPDALKADLQQRHAEYDAAFERHNVEALRQQDREALQAVIDTQPTTLGGIVAKLRVAEIEENSNGGMFTDIALAAIEDADRLAKQGGA